MDTIGPVRFPVVLFDLDGTVVDSGGIILASMRYATRAVLGRDIPDEALMAAVGGPGLEQELRALAPRTLLVSELADQAVCLLALDPGTVGAFGRAVRALAERGVVARVEAEPHL